MALEEMSEAVIQDRLVNFFGKWFDVYFEVTSLCKTKRIDLIMYHNADKEQTYPIGIEIKRQEIKRGTDIGNWCLQAASYTRLLFHEKKCFIFTFPQLSGWYIEEGTKMHKHDINMSGMHGVQNNMNSFIYKSFGIGETQRFSVTWPAKRDHIRLVMNTNQIWSSEDPYTFNTDKLDKL